MEYSNIFIKLFNTIKTTSLIPSVPKMITIEIIPYIIKHNHGSHRSWNLTLTNPSID